MIKKIVCGYYFAFFSWVRLMWIIKFDFVGNDLLQMSQFWSLQTSWFVLMWDFKFAAAENDPSHNSHLWYFWPSWMILICLFRDPVLIKWRIFHKNHIFYFFVLHEVPWYVFSCCLMQWRIYHNNDICNFFVLHEVSSCTCMCIFRSPAWVKVFPQESHLCFLVCSWIFLMCSFKLPISLKHCHKFCNYVQLYCDCFPHELLILALYQSFSYIHTLHSKFFTSPWTIFICWALFCLFKNIFWQISHGSISKL